MAFKFSCFHKIERSIPGAQVVLKSANSEEGEQPGLTNLMDQLKSSFHMNNRKRFGCFDEEKEVLPFKALCQKHHENQIELIALSEAVAKLAENSLSSVEEAFKWHVWITAEAHLPKVLYVFFLETGESYHLNTELEVKTSTSIQPEKLRFALKIDLNEAFETDSKTYITYLSPKTGDMAVAFTHLSGFTEGIDRKEQTAEFLGVVDEYTESLPEEDAIEVRRSFIDYCTEQDRAGEPVQTQELSRRLDEERPDAFAEYYAGKLDNAPNEIYTDRQQLKAYTRFYGRNRGCSISFDTTMFGSEITYNEASESLTFKALPQSLKAQIKRHQAKKAQ